MPARQAALILLCTCPFSLGQFARYSPFVASSHFPVAGPAIGFVGVPYLSSPWNYVWLVPFNGRAAVVPRPASVNSLGQDDPDSGADQKSPRGPSGEAAAPPAQEEAPTERRAEQLCVKEECVKVAADILKNLDASRDPCRDFYQFACGTYEKESYIPEHKTSVGSFPSASDKLYVRLMKIFEAEASEAEPHIFSSIRNYYASCMNLADIEMNSIGALKEVVAELGGWPVLSGDTRADGAFKWEEFLIKGSRLGFSTGIMVSLNIGVHPKNSKQRILTIDEPSFGLDREFLMNGFYDPNIQAYLRHMVDMAVHLGADWAGAAEQMKDVLLLELELASMTLPPEARRNKTAITNLMTLNEVSGLYPEVDWVGLFNDLLDGSQVDGSETVNVFVPRYLREFRELIGVIPARVQANYMMWRHVMTLVPYMGEEVLDIKLKLDRRIIGKRQQAPRWNMCVRSVAGLDDSGLYHVPGSLANGIGAMYVRRHFAGGARQIALDMVENIKDEFREILGEVGWMDGATKERARKKVDAMFYHIAYPDELLDDRVLDSFYDGLTLGPAGYMRNALAIQKFVSRYGLGLFRKPVDKYSWTTHGGAAVVNAFYSPEENAMIFPAGIFSGVFFDADRPLYMNYANIGQVIGHELTHGFDDQGSQRDAEGNIDNWWHPETEERFRDNARCMIEQYGNHSVEVLGEVLSINGVITQGENIADNGGLKQALRAYKKIVKRSGEEPLLPGIKYNQKQLFWIR